MFLFCFYVVFSCFWFSSLFFWFALFFLFFYFWIKPYILCVVGLLTLHLSQELHVFKRKNDIPMPGLSRSISFGTWKNIDPSLGPWALRDGFKRFRRYSTLTHSFRVAFARGHVAFAGGSPHEPEYWIPSWRILMLLNAQIVVVYVTVSHFFSLQRTLSFVQTAFLNGIPAKVSSILLVISQPRKCIISGLNLLHAL